MTNLRKKTRIETQYMVNAVLGEEGHTKKEIKAMILNISMDGALIETAEKIDCRSLMLINTYRNQTVSIHAKIIHLLDVPQEERVFGPFRAGLYFLNNSAGARDFIITIIKSQETADLKNIEDTPPGWMDTEQINTALFSTDTFGDGQELNDVLEHIPELIEMIDESPPQEEETETARHQPEPPLTEPAEPKPQPPASFKETVEQTLFEQNDMKKPVRPPRSIGPALITLLAFTVLLGSLFVFRIPGDGGSTSLVTKLGIDIPFFGERPILPQTDLADPLPESTVPPARLLQSTITSTMVSNDRLGPLFVIRGFIKLEPGHRPEDVTVRGKLLNAEKEIVTSMSIWPGNAIDNPTIAGFTRDDLLRVKDYTPETGYRTRTPFIMIFSDIPESVSSFSVDLTFRTF